MKGIKIIFTVVLLTFIWAGNGFAHFGMIIPSDSMIMQGDNRNINLTISFSHPFEGQGMNMEKPKVMELTANGKKTDLISYLKETKVMGHKAWNINYKVNRPGVYLFHMEPEPYWEPAEDCYIVHYTKTVMAAFGDEDGCG